MIYMVKYLFDLIMMARKYRQFISFKIKKGNL